MPVQGVLERGTWEQGEVGVLFGIFGLFPLVVAGKLVSSVPSTHFNNFAFDFFCIWLFNLIVGIQICAACRQRNS